MARKQLNSGQAFVRFLLFALPIAANVRGYSVVIAAVLFAIYFFSVSGRFRLNGASAKWYVAFTLVTSVWGLASLSWSIDAGRGLTEVSHIFSGLLVGVIIIDATARSSMSNQNWLRAGWVMSFAITSAVALWEAITGNHLPYNPDDLNWDLSSVVFSTFPNPNNYSAYLAAAMCFLYWDVRSGRSNRFRGMSLAMIAVLPFLFVMAGSRLGLVSALVQLAYIVPWRSFLRRKRSELLRIAGGAAVALMIASWSLSSNEIIREKVSGTLEEFSRPDRSASERMNMTWNALHFASESSWFGTGAGSFAMHIRRGDGPNFTGLTVDPHNFWLEVLSQFGVVPFVLLVALVLSIFASGLHPQKRDGSRKFELRHIVVMGMIGYLPAALAASTFIYPPNWIFLASMAALADVVRSSRADVRRS
jgi:teichuronic acid biosynthesis protein TuaE